MSTPNSFYSLLLFISGVIAIWHAVAAWRRPVPITRAIPILLLGMAWWSLTYALHWSTAPRPTPYFWLDATYLGVVILPTAFFIFTLRYTGRDLWLTPRWLFLLSVVPVLTLILLWTDGNHGLFFGGHRSPASTMFDGGPWFWVNTIYTYGLIFASVLLLAYAYGRASHLYKRQARIILIGALLPWAVNALMLVDVEPLPDLDLTPIAFTLTGIAFAYGVRQYRLLDILPVAQGALIEQMVDGVIVLDARDRLVEINPVAQQMLRVTGNALVGQPVTPLFARWPNLVAQFGDMQEGTYHLQIEEDSPQFFDLRLVFLSDRHQQYTGRLLVLRDITLLKKTEIDLRRANSELQERIGQIERLQSQLQEQTIHDDLTGLYTRRYMEGVLEQELVRSAQTGRAVSLLMLDIDLFKHFNDFHGHLAGDAFLQALGDLLRRSTRAQDTACRYGGEEFVVVMPGTEIGGAVLTGERLRLALEGTTISYRGVLLQTTLSVGVAAYPSHATNGYDLLHCADQAMYAAKRGGRNRVAVYDLETGAGNIIK